jgi:hypothetical protein
VGRLFFPGLWINFESMTFRIIYFVSCGYGDIAAGIALRRLFIHRQGHGDKKQDKPRNSVIHGPYNIIFPSRFYSLRRRREVR